MLIVGAAGMTSLLHVRQVVNLTVERTLPAVIELQNLHSSAFQILDSASTLNAWAKVNVSEAERNQEQEEIHEAEQDLHASISILENILAESKEEAEALVQLKHATDEVIDLGRKTLGSPTELGGMKEFREKRESAEAQIREQVKSITTRQHELINSKQNSVHNSLGAAFRVQVIATILCIFAAVVFSILLSNSITAPILKLKNSAELIGQGNFDQQISRGSDDEIGELAQSFVDMLTNLKTNLVSRHYLDSVLNSMQDMVFVVDREHYVRLVNRSACVTLGLKEDLLVGRSFPAVVNVESSDIGLATAGSDRPARETRLKITSGEQIPVSISASPLVQQGELCGMVYVLRDITAQKRSRDEIRSFRERLNRSEHLASLGAMGGVVAHRFNQPLTSLRLFLQQCVRGLTGVNCPEWVLSNLKESLDEVECASRVVREILGFTRRPTVEKSPELDLNKIALTVVSALAETCRVAKLEVSSIDLEKLPKVYGAEDELEEIFFILIQNALQAVGERNKASLTIRGRFDQERIILEFEDTCGGIEPENLDKIFDVFFTTKPRGEGTGLGLSILKQLVADHAGEVEVKSNQGYGTRFTIVLPRSEEHGARDAADHSVRS